MFTSIAFFRSGIASLAIETLAGLLFWALGSAFPFFPVGVSAPGVAGGVASLLGTGIHGFMRA